MRARSRLHLVAWIPSLALLTVGCANGSSASFTMAPLFFSEVAAPDGTIVATSETSGENVTLVPYRPLEQGVETYVAASGNAVLPVNANLPPTPVIALADGSLPISPLLGANGSAAGIALPSLGPVTLSGTLAGLGATAAGVASGPLQLAANATAPLTGALAAATPPVNALVGTATAAATPIVSGATAAVVAPVGAAAAPVLSAAATVVDPAIATIAASAAPVINAATAPVQQATVSVAAPVIAAAAPAVASVAQTVAATAGPVAAVVAHVPAPALITAAALVPPPTNAAPPPAAPPALLTRAATDLAQSCVLGMCR